MKRHDETYHLLNSLQVPASQNRHREAILAQARAHPRTRIQWLSKLREMRAYIYVPQMRYAIMGSVVGCFILIGLFSSPTHQQMAPAPIKLKKSELLIDVTFPEEEWSQDFWSNDPV